MEVMNMDVMVRFSIPWEICMVLQLLNMSMNIDRTCMDVIIKQTVMMEMKVQPCHGTCIVSM